MYQNSSAEGLYVYCIAKANEELDLGPIGLGNRGDNVFSIHYQDLAAIVSESVVMNYTVSRDNTLAHQVVMEKTMEKYTILPVRFGTVAEGPGIIKAGERIRKEVLKERYAELANLLRGMDGKVELGVKVLWNDIQQIFAEITSENTGIKKLRNETKHDLTAKSYKAQIALGKMVKSALDIKKDAEKKKIVGDLKKLSVDYRDNKTFGDQMFLNGAFLVETEAEKAFDDAIEKLVAKQGERLKVRYVGPMPPCNFVEIHINWRKESQGG